MAELLNPNVDFSSLGQLPALLKKGRNEQSLADLGQGLADGTVDYRQAAARTAGMGDITHTLQFLALDEAKKKQALGQQASAQFNQGLFGAQPGPASTMPNSMPVPGAPVRVPAASPPMAMDRAPVQPSAKVWGDDEAEAAGIYEAKPTRMASLAPQGATGARPAPAARPVVAQAASPAPAEAGSFGPQHLPMLFQALGNENLPSGQKETAKLLTTHILGQMKPNERGQYLELMKSRPDLLEIEKGLKAGTTVNIDQKAESEEAKVAGKGAGERRAAMMTAAAAAPQKLQQVARTEALLDQVRQGKIEPARMNVSAWAKSLGLPDGAAEAIGLDPKAVGSAQALKSLINESVVGKIGAGGFPSNNFSNTDREFLVDMFPKLGDDEVGNKIRTEAARRMANLELQRGKDYQSWKKDAANKGKGFEDFEIEYAEKLSKQDIFGDLLKKAGAGPNFQERFGASGRGGTQPNKTSTGVTWSVQ